MSFVVEPDDLNLTVRDGLLQIRYIQSQQHHNGGYTERRYGAFSRTVSLPSGLKSSAAKSTCKHGVLTVRIPRTEESKRAFRRIPVQG
jgi:HSP20 family protein